MTEPYGLPAGATINYKALGFPAWVDDLCRQWGLDSSTYPGHQASDRPDIGAAPNPDGLNRGIDWTGDPQHMLDFAHWLVSIGPPRTPGQYGPPGLEMVIYQDPRTGERVGYPSWVDYGGDYNGHRDHVHTRQSAALIDVVTHELSPQDRCALATINEGRKRGISRRGICIALAVELVESNLTVYANSNVPDSLNYPHEAVGSDHDSTGPFQQRQAWGPLACTMDPACSAGLFFDGGQGGQRGLTALDYDNEANSPGYYAQAVQVSAFPDRYDQRWDEANTLYDRLAGLPDQEDWMSNPELEAMIRQIHACLFNPIDSQSSYRALNEAPGRWQLHELIKNDDGMIHQLYVEQQARDGDPESLRLLTSIATADPAHYPGREEDVARARRFLNSLNTRPPTPAGPAAPATPTVVVAPQPTQPPVNGGLSDQLAHAAAQAAADALAEAKPALEAHEVDAVRAKIKEVLGT